MRHTLQAATGGAVLPLRRLVARMIFIARLEREAWPGVEEREDLLNLRRRSVNVVKIRM